jgi:hypothetical protein
MLTIQPEAGFLNRYLAPYILLPQIAALRLRIYFDRSVFKIVTLLIAVLFLAGAPASLTGPFDNGALLENQLHCGAKG